MSEEVQKLVAVIEARSASAEKQMERFVKSSEKRMATVEAASRKSAARVDGAFASAFTKMGNAAKGALASVAAMFTFSGITSFAGRVKEAANRFDELGDTADRLGTSAGGLVKFQQALNASGGDVKAFNGAAEEFQGAIGKVLTGVKGSKGVEDALKKIGISREQINNAGTLEQRLLLVADGLSKVGDSAARAALAEKLGIRPLLPLLEKGRDGVLALTNQFNELGDAANTGVKRTKDMADKIVALEAAMQLKSDNLFIQLTPILIEVYGQISDILSLMNDPRWSRIGTLAQLFQFLPGFNAGLALGVTAPLPTKIEGYNRDIANKRAEMQDTGVGYFGQIGPKQRAERNARLQREIDVLEAARAREVRAALTGIGGGVAPPRRSTKAGPLAPSAEDTAAADKAAKAIAKEAADLAKESAEASKRVKELGKDLLATYSDEARAKLEKTTQEFRDQADAAAAFKDSFRGDFVESFKYAVQTGDIGGAFMHLAETFSDRILEKLGNQAFDALWDAGFGGIATDLFGDADLAQATFATSTTTATTAVEALASAAWSAANALQGSSGGGSGSGWGAVLNALGMGSVSGATKGAGAGMFGGLIPGRATGGPVSAGMPYIVGETRPELFVPNVSGHIIPRIPQATPAAANSSAMGAPVVNLNVNISNPTVESIPGIKRELAELKAGLPRTIEAVTNNAMSRRRVGTAR